MDSFQLLETFHFSLEQTWLDVSFQRLVSRLFRLVCLHVFQATLPAPKDVVPYSRNDENTRGFE